MLILSTVATNLVALMLALGLAGCCTCQCLPAGDERPPARLEQHAARLAWDLSRAQMFVEGFPGAVLQIRQVKLVGPGGDVSLQALSSISFPLVGRDGLLDLPKIRRFAAELREPVVLLLDGQTVEIQPEDRSPVVSFYPVLTI